MQIFLEEDPLRVDAHTVVMRTTGETPPQFPFATPFPFSASAGLPRSPTSQSHPIHPRQGVGLTWQAGGGFLLGLLLGMGISCLQGALGVGGVLVGKGIHQAQHVQGWVEKAAGSPRWLAGWETSGAAGRPPPLGSSPLLSSSWALEAEALLLQPCFLYLPLIFRCIPALPFLEFPSRAAVT